MNVGLGLEDKFVIIVCCSPGLWSTSGDGSASGNLASILSLLFMCLVVSATLIEKRGRWRKKDKEEKFVMGVVKKKELGFQDPCSIPIFVRNRLVVSLVSKL